MKNIPLINERASLPVNAEKTTKVLLADQLLPYLMEFQSNGIRQRYLTRPGESTAIPPQAPPVQLITPASTKLSAIRRVSYLTDLRYCRNDIVRFLIDLTKSLSADLSIAHVTLPGLVNLDPDYANQIFKEQVQTPANSSHINFHYTRDEIPEKVADVLISGLNQDMLVFSANSKLWQRFKDRYQNDEHRDELQVPLLVFPS